MARRPRKRRKKLKMTKSAIASRRWYRKHKAKVKRRRSRGRKHR